MTIHTGRHGGPGGGVGTEVVGRDLRGYFCGHTWAASPLKGRRDGIRSDWARLPPDGHPTCPLSLKAGRGQGSLWPLGSDLPWLFCQRQRNRLCETPELADQASQGATGWGLGGQAKAGSHRLPRQSRGRIRAAGGGASCCWSLTKMHLPGEGLETSCCLTLCPWPMSTERGCGSVMKVLA